MGRWRPTSAVVLVYSTMGLTPLGALTKEFDLNVEENFATQSALNEQQLSGLSALQKHALQAETDISQQLAVLQVWCMHACSIMSCMPHRTHCVYYWDGLHFLCFCTDLDFFAFQVTVKIYVDCFKLQGDLEHNRCSML